MSMQRISSLAITATIALAVHAVSGQAPGQLSQPDVDTAIQQGLAGKTLASACMAKGGGLNSGPMSGVFQVRVEGPVGSIMAAAAEAKKKYLPFTSADVTEGMRAHKLFVTVVPDPPMRVSSGMRRTAPATHVVLKSKPKGDAEPVVLQPLSFTLVPVEFGNAMGGKSDSQGISAVFDLAAFKAITDPEVDIVIITDAGERRCKIGEKDKASIR